ncbi:hypothetical protein D3C72_1739460 [compost metagenome]
MAGHEEVGDSVAGPQAQGEEAPGSAMHVGFVVGVGESRKGRFTCRTAATQEVRALWVAREQPLALRGRSGA